MSGMDLVGLSAYNLLKADGQDLPSVLTSSITSFMLLFTAAFLTGVQLIGEPIECWCPAELTDAMCNYTKSLCWTSSQYVISYDDAIPHNPGLRPEVQKREIQFYPMVPFILMLLAMVLKMPSFLWSAFQDEDGLNVTKAVQLANKQDQEDDDTGRVVAFEMNFNINKIVTGRSQWISVKELASALVLFPMGCHLGTYQTGLFLFTRLLAVVLNVLAYPALSYALQMDYLSWGPVLLSWLALEDEEKEPLMYAFPRETLCDFRVRQLQNVQDYTVQCVLPINMWSEKVFLGLWFWLLLLLLGNIYSYFYWFRKLLLPDNRRALLTKHLTILFPEIQQTHRGHIVDFTWNYLSYDSVLVLRILEMAAGSRVANVVVEHLWADYLRRLEDVSDRDVMGPDDVGY